MVYDYYKKNYFKPKNKTPLKPFFIIFLLAFLLFIAANLRTKALTNKTTLKVVNLSNDNPLVQTPTNLSNLKTQVKKIIKDKKGSYFVYFKDLNSDDEIGINEETIVAAASVNKIPILASVYYLADQGKIDLNEKITIQQKDIQSYGTGIIQNQGAGVVYSIKNLARIMMENSDNTASYILGSQIAGLNKIQELINSWGLRQTDMINNKTSNLDMFRILQKMYRGEITSKSATMEMIGFMDDSDFEERLPAKLPENVKVYHKIGNEVGVIHDVGLIVLPNEKVYYLGVLTSDITDENEAKAAIAEISRLVYDFESKKN